MGIAEVSSSIIFHSIQESIEREIMNAGMDVDLIVTTGGVRYDFDALSFVYDTFSVWGTKIASSPFLRKSEPFYLVESMRNLVRFIVAQLILI